MRDKLPVVHITGQVHHPSSVALRCVVAAWLCSSLVLYASYAANLTAFLTVTKYKLPFNTLEEMAAQTEYAYGLTEDNGLRQVFQVI